MSETTITVITEPDTEASAGRTYHRADYKRTAKLLQSFRHVKGSLYAPKPTACQEQVDGMAEMLAQIFAGDAELPGDSFDPAKFLASTQLPEVPALEDEIEEDAETGEEPPF